MSINIPGIISWKGVFSIIITIFPFSSDCIQLSGLSVDIIVGNAQWFSLVK